MSNLAQKSTKNARKWRVREFGSISKYLRWLVNDDYARNGKNKMGQTTQTESDQKKLERLVSELGTLKINMERSGKLPALDFLYKDRLGLTPKKGETPVSPKYLVRVREAITNAVLDYGGVIRYKDRRQVEKMINIDLGDITQYVHIADMLRELWNLRCKINAKKATAQVAAAEDATEDKAEKLVPNRNRLSTQPAEN